MQEPVVDMVQVLDSMIERYHQIPTDVRKANLQREAELRRRLQATAVAR